MKKKTWLLHGSYDGNTIEYEKEVKIAGDPSWGELAEWEDYIISKGYSFFEYVEE